MWTRSAFWGEQGALAKTDSVGQRIPFHIENWPFAIMGIKRTHLSCSGFVPNLEFAASEIGNLPLSHTWRLKTTPYIPFGVLYMVFSHQSENGNGARKIKKVAPRGSWPEYRLGILLLFSVFAILRNSAVWEFRPYFLTKPPRR